jgi:hypothetical protein
MILSRAVLRILPLAKPGGAACGQTAQKLHAGRLRGILNAVRPGQNRGPWPATYGVVMATKTESNHANQSKARGSRHPYDNPRLGPRGFFLAIMHDTTAPLHVRIDAACKLLELWPELYNDYAPACIIHINGEGIPIQ